jgi:2-hydroxychromene-2-carboxylate isomerase
MCESHGAELVYRPMLLGGVYQATGNASPATIPVKARYWQLDYERHARRYGVPLKENVHFPIITLFLMRAVTGVQLRRPEQLQQLLGCVFKALWIDALNLNEPQLTADILKAGGFDPAEIERLTQDPQTKTALKATTEEAVKRGVFGAPTIFVGDQMFFGQDRMDFVREALAA